MELEVEGNVVIIHSVLMRRSGWSEAFSGTAHREDNKLLDRYTPRQSGIKKSGVGSFSL